MKTLIKGGLVLSMDKKRQAPVDFLDIVITDDTITEMDSPHEETYDQIIDATGKLIMPGLINAHTHMGMSLFRNCSDQESLQDWLEKKIWPVEEKLTEDDLYYTTMLSIIEMIKTGTTCCADSYFGFLGGVKALEETKFRCLYTRFLMGNGDEASLERMEEFKNMYQKNKEQPLLTFAVSPHSLYTSSREYLLTCKDLAQEYQLPLHLHFCENKKELRDIKKIYHKKPVKVLEELGFLEHKLLLAHGTFISKEEQKLLKGKDISIIHNPLSNLTLGCGIADITSLRKNGLNVCLGSDGQGSGNHLNLFRHMALACDLQKALYQDPTVISSYEILEMATINGAKALGLEDKIGSLEVGKKADLIMLDLNTIMTTPTTNLLNQLVHNITEENIVMTMINGNILMLDGNLELPVTEDFVKERVNDIAENLIVF